MYTTVDPRTLTARSRPRVLDSTIRDRDTSRDERRGVAKGDVVVHLLDELADDPIRVHVALSMLCSEVPEQLDSARVDFKLIPQGGNPVLDVGWHLPRAA